MTLRRTNFRPYVMRHCPTCNGDRPHTAKGECVPCDQRAKATTPGRKIYQQGRALKRAKVRLKSGAETRKVPWKSPTKQAADAAVSLAKARARKRAGGVCEVCGQPCKIGHGHHRRPQQQGGSSSLEVQSAANIIWIHPECHEHLESFRTHSYQLGRLVFQSADPAKVPVLLHSGWHLLADDGSMTRVNPPETEVS
jgi:hypothetical protein